MSTRIESPPAAAAREPVGRKGALPARSSEGRLLYGVAAGLGDYAGVDPTIVRIAFAVLSLAGGLGVLLYVGLALVLREAPGGAARVRRSGLKPVAGVGLITAGLLLAARQAGLWFGDDLVGPVAIAALGASVLWIRSDGASSGRVDAAANPLETLFQGRVSPLRVVMGATLIVVGAGAFLAANSDPSTAPVQLLRTLLVPVLATIAGLLLIFGPWLYRLAAQLSDERRERIRSEERSALAAHLHDSVLQTLALIQRADGPQQMAHLARTQERELRAWLFGKVGSLTDETVAGALETLAARVESHHPVKVDVVVVGDAAVDERMGALIAACGEAVTNAAKHSGASGVSVYAECEDALVTVYVRDQGAGFSVGAVGPDRRGLRESIEGRVRRAGGTAVIQSEAGAGTEVILTMPRPSA